MIKIIPILSLQDNYIWAIVNTDSMQIAVVDPGTAKPVLDYIKSQNLILTTILLTHHHNDHIGGVAELLKNFSVSVYGPKNQFISSVTKALRDGDIIQMPEYNMTLQAMEIPGHTLDHVAYFNNDLVFCGDTLFTGGCGKIFEGTPEQMFNSLQKLSHLPENTKIYCGHEYTVNNLKFALQVETDNTKLISRLEQSKDLREQNLPTVPSTMGEELATNPFLRVNQSGVRDSICAHINRYDCDEIDLFAALREWKNSF